MSYLLAETLNVREGIKHIKQEALYMKATWWSSDFHLCTEKACGSTCMLLFREQFHCRIEKYITGALILCITHTTPLQVDLSQT